jgi:hypothetical protein
MEEREEVLFYFSVSGTERTHGTQTYGKNTHKKKDFYTTVNAGNLELRSLLTLLQMFSRTNGAVLISNGDMINGPAIGTEPRFA